jgi:hypothetical protein
MAWFSRMFFWLALSGVNIVLAEVQISVNLLYLSHDLISHSTVHEMLWENDRHHHYLAVEFWLIIELHLIAVSKFVFMLAHDESCSAGQWQRQIFPE